MHIATHWDNENQAMLVTNRYHPEYGDRVAFVAITPEADSYSGDRTAFIGRNSSLTQPAAMELTKLSGRVGAGLDPCAALRVSLTIPPGEQKYITCMLGQADRAQRPGNWCSALVKIMRWKTPCKRPNPGGMRLLGTIEVHTPELAADLLINRWLQYQSLGCRLWERPPFTSPAAPSAFAISCSSRCNGLSL